MLQVVRERLTLLLLALLPFHALLVTVGTKVLSGSGHAPLSSLALWKEGVLGVVMVLAVLERVKSEESKVKSVTNRVDLLDVLVLFFLFLGIVVSTLHSSLFTLHFVFGFKYDFLPFVAFLFLRRVPWSEQFRRLAFATLIAAGGIVASYGLVTIFLPDAFFRFLGYSDLHSLYVPDGPIAAFQQIGGAALRRVQSTMSGPNQLGLWLLIPFSLLLVRVRRWLILLLIVVAAALAFTFSRAAWIGAVVSVGIVFSYRTLPAFSRRMTIGFLAAIILVVALAFLLWPNVLLRAASSRDHLLRPLAAVRTIIDHPLGLSLGTAGPASNRVSDACVYLPVDGDTSWAAAHPQLCVFLGDVQVQPDAPCSCPFLPENWYLQIGVELGVIGLVLFVSLIIALLFRLRRDATPLGVGVFAAFAGVSVAALFLHAWEDSAVALTLWLLAAVFVSVRKTRAT